MKSKKSLIVKFPPTKVIGNSREERIKNLQDVMKNPQYTKLIQFEEEIMTISEIRSKDVRIKIK